MKFSIITPSYNQGKYIKDTLDSVLSIQQGCDIEHIVIDGGSQDETIKILKEYSNIYSNLTWYSSPDQGQSDAINKGLSLAQGEIVAYINSDDYYLPNSFIKVREIFQKHPEVDFLYGDIFLVNQLGKITKFVKSIRTSMWEHIYSFPFLQQSCFWRKSTLNLIPEFNIHNHSCMDSEYFAYLLNHQFTFCRISIPLACFRIHNQSKTGSKKLLEEHARQRELLRRTFMPLRPIPPSIMYLIGRVTKQLKLIIRPKFEVFVPTK